MRIAAVIPARYASSRFPGKPLALIAGVPMIERVYRQVERAVGFCARVVATDDARIAAAVRAFGGDVRLTPSDLPSGSARVWSVLESSDWDAAVNIQGDEPLIAPELVARIAQALESGADVVTAVCRNTSHEDFLSPHVVKAVVADDGNVLYFSRSPIPFHRDSSFSDFLQHVGIYGYSRRALQAYVAAPPYSAESLECLEQLRFLNLGFRMFAVHTDFRSIGVDVPDDVRRIEEILRGNHG